MIINLSEKAVDQVKQITLDQKNTTQGLRLGVTGGGCSGFTYKIEFSDEKENDLIQTIEGLKILIDPKSAVYLKGTELDFEDGLSGKGFVFKNPNAKNTCGCGESFSV